MNYKKITLYIAVVVLVTISFVLIAPQLFKKQIEVAVKDVTKEFITTPVSFTDLNISFFSF